METRILIIDSDISLATVLSDYLASRGYKTQHVSSGHIGLDALERAHWDIILMDLMVDDMNGYELLKEIRHRHEMLPVIILTNRSDREAQVRAFQLGCDDYQLKPFSMDILICRIEAILRRFRFEEDNKQKVFHLSSAVFDATRQTFNGLHMSSRESDLLLMLCRHEGDVVDRHRILASLWDEDNAFTASSLGVYINHLRQFLQPIGYSIITVRGKGYKLVSEA